MKVDFKKVVFKEMDGKARKSDHAEKMVADLVYNFSTHIDQLAIALEINKTGIAELNKGQLAQIRATIESGPTIYAWVKKGILDFIDEQVKKIKDSKEG